nr:DUF1344 domain-containing protein [uncultured Gellertiella sp.]
MRIFARLCLALSLLLPLPGLAGASAKREWVGGTILLITRTMILLSDGRTYVFPREQDLSLDGFMTGTMVRIIYVQIGARRVIKDVDYLR